MKTYKINEIFYSIQGEGFYAGTPAIFIRFANCNLKCDFCDTEHEVKLELTRDEIYNKIKEYPCRHIVLTGGEPTMQVDMELAFSLRLKNYYLQIETNGTNKIKNADIDFSSAIDWITVSPKINWIEQQGNELKLVYLKQDLKQYEKANFNHFYLQPKFSESPEETKYNINETIKAIKENPKWKLSLQIQKLINIK
jgi:organic radical activating enzyme